MKKIAPLLFSSLALFASTVTVDKVQDNALVIYNANKALVHEERALSVTPQTTQITYKDVASTINTDSVNISLPDGIELYSQQYKYDKLTLYKLLEAHINQQVQVRQDNNTTIDATLLSTSGRVLVRTKQNNIISVNANNIIFHSIPQTLLIKPSLVWNVKVHNTIKQDMNIDYLINNISFKSDYTLDVQNNSANLTGWLTIKNNSGKAFHNTKLSLLAGDVHFAKPHNIQPVMYKEYVVQDAARATVHHQAYEGYHFYTVPFRVDIADKETTQVKFLTHNNIAIKRLYEATLGYPFSIHGERKASVVQSISFVTEEPLPKGIVRVYGTLNKQKILIGETSLAHTPKKENVQLTLGKNFDLKVTQTLLDEEHRTDYDRSRIRYTIKNSSNKTKKVTLYVPFSKEKYAKITSNQPYTFTKGNLVTFTLNVIPNATATFVAEYELKK